MIILRVNKNNMNYQDIQKKYNKIIYLELIDNTIKDYNKELMIKLKQMINEEITYQEYYMIWNKTKIDMIKEWCYYNDIPSRL